MQNLYNDLAKLLEKDERVFTEGKVLKNKITELAIKLDNQLLKLLLQNKQIKEHFFVEAEGILVFDKDKFVKFVNNKEFLPNSFTVFKNRIGLIEGDEYLKDSGEVVLAWPYKDCVLEGGQEKEDVKIDEIFYNEILAPDEIDRLFEPKVITNVKRIDKNGEYDVLQITEQDNLIIKGNNLLTLHTLKKKYRGKIKLIYIDPPYNTPGDANTFSYNNSFNHSSWLTFIKNRVEVSKDMLKNDGVLAIAIDDEEQAYLKILCDEIFGRENYMGTLIIQSKPSGRTTDTYFATSHEYVLFYSKEPNMPEINFFELSDKEKKKYKEGEGKNSHKWRDFLRTGGYSTPEERPNSYYPIYFNPKTNHITLEKQGNDYVEILPLDSNGNKRVWRKTPKSFIQHLKYNEIKILKNKNNDWKVKIIDKIKVGIRPKSIWLDSKYDASSHGTKLLKDIFEGEKVFSFPKSLYAVKDIIDIFTEKEGDDIILDFFAGSGTTAHAVLELNNEDGGQRRFILCEQMDYVEKVTKTRVKKVIENNKNESFIYMELKKWNEDYMQSIQRAISSKDLFSIYQTMQKEAFFRYEVDLSKFDNNEFVELPIEDQKKVLVECLDKNHLYVNYAEIDDVTYKIPLEEKKLNREFYGN